MFFLSQGPRLMSAGRCAVRSGYFSGKARACDTTPHNNSDCPVTERRGPVRRVIALD